MAGVAGAAAAIVFGLIPLLRERRRTADPVAKGPEAALPSGVGDRSPVVVGEIPEEPLGFQPRAGLLATLNVPESNPQAVAVHAVTGMRGAGKTHLAAAYARAKLAERWQLVAWINASDLGAVLAGLAAVADGLDLAASMGKCRSGRPRERGDMLALADRMKLDGDLVPRALAACPQTSGQEGRSA